MSQIKSGHFHHVYILENWTEKDILEVTDEIKKVLVKDVDVNDIFFDNFGNLNIKEVRNIKEKAYISAIKKVKLFFIKISDITREAENALLKLFEEPPSNSHFFIFSPDIKFSKTILSRVIKIKGQNDEENQDIKKFLKMSIGEKIEMAKKISDKTKEDRDKNEILDFLSALEKEIINRNSKDKKISGILREIEISKNFLRDKSASIKMILENIFIQSEVFLKNGQKI